MASIILVFTIDLSECAARAAITNANTKKMAAPMSAPRVALSKKLGAKLIGRIFIESTPGGYKGFFIGIDLADRIKFGAVRIGEGMVRQQVLGLVADAPEPHGGQEFLEAEMVERRPAAVPRQQEPRIGQEVFPPPGGVGGAALATSLWL